MHLLVNCYEIFIKTQENQSLVSMSIITGCLELFYFDFENSN